MLVMETGGAAAEDEDIEKMMARIGHMGPDSSRKSTPDDAKPTVGNTTDHEND